MKHFGYSGTGINAPTAQTAFRFMANLSSAMLKGIASLEEALRLARAQLRVGMLYPQAFTLTLPNVLSTSRVDRYSLKSKARLPGVTAGLRHGNSYKRCAEWLLG